MAPEVLSGAMERRFAYDCKASWSGQCKDVTVH